MRLIVITPEATRPGEPALARRMLDDAGLKTLHLRKPRAGRAELAAYLAELGGPTRTRRVVLHSHHDLADEFPLKGIHFREADVPAGAPPLPPPRSPDLTQSTSLHSLAAAAAPWGPHLSYAFLSPVFDSLSKPGYAAAGFDPAQVRAVATRSGAPPLIALGGVTAERLADAKGMGFSGAAVLGSVWQAADPVAAVAELVKACAVLGGDGDDDSDAARK